MLDRIELALPSICATAFGARARPVGLRALAHGAESHVFAFDLVRDDQPPEPLALKLYTSGRSAAATEHRVTTGTRAQGYPATELLYLERAAEPLGFAFTLMKRIDGGQLAEAMRGAGRSRSRELARRFATLLADLHRLDPEPVLGPTADAGAALDAELARCRQALTSMQVPELSPVLDWLDAERRCLAPRGPSVIHQDFHPRNVLLDRRDRLHVIDWTIARVTDPRSDLALAFLMLAQAGYPELRTAIEEDYQAASEQPLTDMGFFDVMSCLKSFAGRYAVLDDAEHKRPALWARVSRRPGWQEQLATLRKSARPLRRMYRTIREHTSLRVPQVEALLDRLHESSATRATPRRR